MHKQRFSKRHIIHLTAILLCLLVGITALIVAQQWADRTPPAPVPVDQTPPVDEAQAQARANYLAAQQAWQQGDLTTFNRLTATLTNYPLYPYLVILPLLAHIDSLTPNDYEQFIKTYQDGPLNKQLNNAWLESLAQQNQWSTFANYYSQSLANANLTCFYGQALIATGQQAQANQLAQQLWLTDHAQPKSCDPLFVDWIGQGLLTTDLMRQRFEMAVKVDNLSLAKHVLSLMPADEQLTANLWLNIIADPKKIMNATWFPANTENNNTILTDGLVRIAKKDPKLAITDWDKLRKEHHFSLEQMQVICVAITTKLIMTDPDLAFQWVNQIDPQYIAPLNLTYRLQLALAKPDWNLILKWSPLLSASDKSDPAWQYWEARALDATGQQDAAKAIWTQLATLRHYYGFLAAVKVGAPFALNDYQLPVSDADLARAEAIPGIARAGELFALQQIDAGDKEWWAALDQMSEDDRYYAAHLAANNGWYSIALATTGRIAHKDDLRIRFPTFYQGDVMAAAHLGNLDPAFIFAIIRQESLFRPDAESGVGAQGLMQLMPATAQELVQKNQLPVSYVNMLADPSVNIALGGRYLSWLQQQVQSPALIAAAYNAGIGRVRSWLPLQAQDIDIWVDRIPFEQTRDYVKNVVSYAIVYQYLLGEQPNLATLMPQQVQKPA